MASTSQQLQLNPEPTSLSSISIIMWNKNKLLWHYNSIYYYDKNLVKNNRSLQVLKQVILFENRDKIE